LFFLYSENGIKQKYAGNATPKQVQDAITKAFPQYEDKLGDQLRNSPDLVDANPLNFEEKILKLQGYKIGSLISNFINDIQSFPPPTSDSEWVTLSDNVRENTSWININYLKRVIFITKNNTTQTYINSNGNFESINILKSKMLPIRSPI